MKKKILKTFCWILIISYLSGCTTTEIVQYKAELNDPEKTGTLVVTTKDSTEYELESYKLNDSLLSGTGTISMNDTTKNFKGSINLKDIISIEGEKVSIERTILGFGIVGLFAIAYLQFSKASNDGTKVKATYVTPSGGIGCK